MQIVYALTRVRHPSCREGMEYERPMGVFVDFQKAFDCNDQSVIIAVLESYDLDSRLSD